MEDLIGRQPMHLGKSGGREQVVDGCRGGALAAVTRCQRGLRNPLRRNIRLAKPSAFPRMRLKSQNFFQSFGGEALLRTHANTLSQPCVRGNVPAARARSAV